MLAHLRNKFSPFCFFSIDPSNHLYKNESYLIEIKLQLYLHSDQKKQEPNNTKDNIEHQICLRNQFYVASFRNQKIHEKEPPSQSQRRTPDRRSFQLHEQ